MTAREACNKEGSRPNSRIAFLPDRVVKTYPEHAEVEFAKAKALFAISREEDFDTPEPLILDAAAQTVAFSRCDGTRTIKHDYLRYMKAQSGEEIAVERCAAAGRVLASIHARLALPHANPWNPSADFLAALSREGRYVICEKLAELPHAFLHCDYGLENIEAREEGGSRLTIFDPSPNYFVTFDADCRGPIYVDIGHFLSVIAGLIRPIEQLRAHWSRRRALAEAFIGAYELHAGLLCDRRVALWFARGIAGAYLRRRYPRPIADLATFVTFSPHRGKFL